VDRRGEHEQPDTRDNEPPWLHRRRTVSGGRSTRPRTRGCPGVGVSPHR
jgi:hypothetical protein